MSPEPASNPATQSSQAPGGPGRASGHQSRRRSLILVGVVLLVLVAIVWWLTRGQGSSAATRRERMAFFGADAAIPVVAQTVQPGEIDIYKNGLGTVTPLATVVVRTRISGQLTEIHFKEGQEVREGDLLAIIDPRPYQVALEQAQGQLMQAQAQLAQARSDYARYQTLSRQDSIAQQQVDSQRALVNQYEGLVKTDEAAVDNAKLNLVYCHITAPQNGRVGLRQVDPGNYVTPGDANGLVTLTEVRPISVIFTLPEDNYAQVAARLRAGAKMPVTAYDASQQTQLAAGTLQAIDNEADPSTGTFKLRAVFQNDDEVLFPNEFVNVQLLLGTERNVLVIQNSALEQGQAGTYVYVIQADGTVTARPVTLGPAQGERVAILKGLAAGEQVVIEGADRLKEGSRVTVQAAGAGNGPGGPATSAPVLADPAAQHPKGAKGNWHHSGPKPGPAQSS